MELLRVWRTRLLGGAAVAVILPAAVLVALLGAGLSGGLGGVGALGQALTGPEMPQPDQAAAASPDRDGARDDEDIGRLLARTAPPRPTATPARPGRPGSTPRRPSNGSGGGQERRPRPTPRPPAPATPTSTPSPTPTPQPTPTPTPTPTPSVLRQVGDSVKKVTDPVPIVGEPVGQVVDTLVDALDAIVPPR